jgi:heme/copper-type cytochrome/quinol oxidase subunit 2
MGTLHRTLVVFVVAIALVASACGDSDESADQPATAAPTAAPGPAATPVPTTPPATPAPATQAPPAPPPVTPAPATVTTVASPEPTAPPPTAAPTTTTIEPGPLRIEVDVYEGQVAGDTEVVIERGTEIEIVVTADVSDEVHVHGYDQKAEVAPDSPAVITFVANLPGIYEVELEDSGQHIIELEVR